MKMMQKSTVLDISDFETEPVVKKPPLDIEVFSEPLEDPHIIEDILDSYFYKVA